MICSFFGHRDTPDTAEKILENTLKLLISEQHISMFYVGNNGKFDKMVQKQLHKLSHQYNIKYTIVLSCLSDSINEDYIKHTVFPEGIEKIPHKFRINWRNKWMLKQSDIVITYVTHPSSGAYKYKLLAEKQKKIVISLV